MENVIYFSATVGELVGAGIALLSLILDAFVLGQMHQRKKQGDYHG